MYGKEEQISRALLALTQLQAEPGLSDTERRQQAMEVRASVPHLAAMEALNRALRAPNTGHAAQPPAP